MPREPQCFDHVLGDLIQSHAHDGRRFYESPAIAVIGFGFVFQSDLIHPFYGMKTVKLEEIVRIIECQLRAERRMLHKAEEWQLICHAPKLKLMKEYGRSLRLDDEAEKKLLAGAAACDWRKRSLQLFRDIIILMRDTGMRNERELYRMRIENLDWASRVIFVPDSKTEEGRRRVPMSTRVFDILKQRFEGRHAGWVFPSKRAKSAHLTTMAKRFQEARVKAGLPSDLVLYCGRHDYGTRILKRTGNLAAVMRTMGHRDVKTAMQYQHPELEIVRAALDHDTAAEKRA
jgi:integrase